MKKSAEIEKLVQEALRDAATGLRMPLAYVSGLNDALFIIREVRGTCRIGRRA